MKYVTKAGDVERTRGNDFRTLSCIPKKPSLQMQLNINQRKKGVFTARYRKVILERL